MIIINKRKSKVFATYTFQDVLLFFKNREIIIYDHDHQEVGAIIRENDTTDLDNKKLDMETYYAFRDVSGDIVTSTALKRNSFFKGHQYIVQRYQEGSTFELNEKGISLSFHLRGHVNQLLFEVKQDLRGRLVCKVEQVKYAMIQCDEETSSVTIEVFGQPDPFLIDPSFLSLIYCLYRIEESENRIMEKVASIFTFGK